MWVGLSTMATSLIAGGVADAAAEESPYIRDRNDVPLVERGDADQPLRFPLRAVAAQLLASLAETAPDRSGLPLQLALDARIQSIAERELRAVPRGAVVVVDPSNGDILAMASLPSFDPNALSEIRGRLAADQTGPLTNRAINSYAPGAAFTVVTGLAGAGKGMADARFECHGGVTYGTKMMKCWIASKEGKHGSLALDEALHLSCGPFFYQYGNAAGIEAIQAIGRSLGLGTRSGIPLREEGPGILPGPDWLAQVLPTERWSMGYTANVSIGQGSVEATPLQMAMVAAAIGNGGQSFHPRLLLNDPVRLRADLRNEGKLTAELERVRLGMWKTVNEPGGSGKRARVAGATVAGRTGTAQFWREEAGTKVRDHHTWFIGFAPFEEPKLAICVFVQGAKSGGGVSAPIAGRILQGALLGGGESAVQAMEPAVGSFDQTGNVPEVER
jgi:penicillin-binding protein 2